MLTGFERPDFGNMRNGTTRADRPRRLLVIYNPTAGLRRRGHLSRTVDVLRTLGCALDLRETGWRGHAERLAAEADPGEVDAVVAAGGDGTINEVANGLCAAASSGRPPLPLGIIPLGTANVLARELRLPDGAEDLARCLAAAPARAMHPGRVTGPDGVSRLFLQMLGVGMDARVVAGVDPYLKKRVGKGAYVLRTLREILAGPRLDYRLRLTGPDGGECLVDVASAVVARGRFYGGTFVLAPSADLFRPSFQVCLFRRGGRVPAFAYTAGMVLGGLSRLPGYQVLPAIRLTVEGPAGEPVQGDGDVVGVLPAVVDLAPVALPLIGP